MTYRFYLFRENGTFSKYKFQYKLNLECWYGTAYEWPDTATSQPGILCDSEYRSHSFKQRQCQCLGSCGNKCPYIFRRYDADSDPWLLEIVRFPLYLFSSLLMAQALQFPKPLTFLSQSLNLQKKWRNKFSEKIFSLALRGFLWPSEIGTEMHGVHQMPGIALCLLQRV